MLITRECDYAVRVIRALAGEERLSVSDICEREAITAPFAYKILKKLQKAGLVKGYRGVHGGYAIKGNLDEMTLFDVYQAIDPGLFIIDCMEPGYHCVRNGCDGLECRVHHELAGIQMELWEMLKRKSVKELLRLE